MGFRLVGKWWNYFFFYIDEVLFLGMVVWMFVNNFILLLLCNLVNNRVIFWINSFILIL